jgi:hypothetical protein
MTILDWKLKIKWIQPYHTRGDRVASPFALNEHNAQSPWAADVETVGSLTFLTCKRGYLRPVHSNRKGGDRVQTGCATKFINFSQYAQELPAHRCIRFKTQPCEPST